MGKKMMTVIPAKKPEQLLTPEGYAITKVAAYARVSTLASEQEDSYESQRKFYQDLINSTPGWNLTEIYSDQASGLNTKKRTGFKKMMADAKKGKFKLLLVKSISRFGRNTLDTISSIRELKSYGCVVKFQKEALSTDSPQIDFLLTIMSSMAEQESLSISQNTTWGFRAKHSRGEWSMRTDNFLGYTADSEGNLVIEEEGAETIRMIYDLFLSGMSSGDVAKRLEQESRKTGTGNTKWTKTAITRILNQEKHCGDCLIQKTVMDDVISKKQVKNDGQAPMYYLRDDHPAIVTRQQHLLAKGEIMRREADFMGSEIEGPSVWGGKNLFTHKIVCAECGAFYDRARARDFYVWKCYHRVNGNCKAEIIKQSELEEVTLKAVQKLWDRKPVIKEKAVPELDPEDDDKKLMKAAGLYSFNVFAKRITDLISGPRPESFSDIDPQWIIERIDIEPEAFVISFYGDQTIRVDREQTARRAVVRSLSRARKGSA